jgi:hypothetical protein
MRSLSQRLISLNDSSSERYRSGRRYRSVIASG